MTDPGAPVSVTRSAWLELKDEERLMREGYEFLDEKRMILASELLQRLSRYERASGPLEDARRRAIEDLARAVARHGMDDLHAVAPERLLGFHPQIVEESLLGVRLEDGRASLEVGEPERPRVEPTPEVRRVAEAFRALVADLFVLAVARGTVSRLAHEYERTERRARALENVLLPELEGRLRFMAEQLETLDQEDVMRVRFCGPPRDPAETP